MNKTDHLVIGSGIAGLTFALEVADRGSVILVTKKHHSESNTNYAQGGIAAAIGSEDSYEKHIDDTIRAGAGLSDHRAVTFMIREGPNRIRDLQKWGVSFSYFWRDKSQVLALGREGGHSTSRIVHKADYTGREVEQTLVQRCQEHRNIEIIEHSAVMDLALVRRGGKARCVGAWVLTPGGKRELIVAPVTMLATGGCGQVYLHTTNPAIATGDGIAMAYRAGTRIANLEFMQFHPTALFPPEDQAFLISEAVRGFGGVLRTTDGDQFMPRYHPMGDLAPRDVVARTIDLVLKTRGDNCVYLDITGRLPDEVRERFPSIYKHCLERNLDITRQWIPVVPAAHYMCGGVLTDLYGQTSLPGLYATGEVACSRVHGANRLASNSLLEALVFAHNAAQRVLKEPRQSIPRQPPLPPEPGNTGSYSEEEWVLVSHDRHQLRQLMWDYVGIVRSTLRLERARRRVELIRGEVEDLCRRVRLTPALVELRNIALVASLIIRCALRRKESRGLHYTTDHPKPDDRRPPRDTVLVSRAR